MFIWLVVIAVLILALINYHEIKMIYRLNFIEKFKYERSAKEREDIGLEKASKIWFQYYEKRFNVGFLNFLFNNSLSKPSEKVRNLNAFYRNCVK